VAPPPDRLALSVYEAAHVLGVSVHTVWRMIASGRLASFKLGRRRLIARSAVEALLLEGTTTEASA
jgi:excisionase family DNA binding protein